VRLLLVRLLSCLPGSSNPVRQLIDDLGRRVGNLLDRSRCVAHTIGDLLDARDNRVDSQELGVHCVDRDIGLGEERHEARIEVIGEPPH